jgi:hypothetical protein
MSRRLALLVATYSYQDPALQHLTAPGNDAEALAEILHNPEIADFDVTVKINEPLHVVGEAIGDFFHNRRRDDLTLLYFTGHGLKDDQGRLYLAMSNTKHDQLLFTGLPAIQINDAMDSCPSRQKLLILDCCYSGAFPAGHLAKGDRQVHALERFGGRGRVVLTASDAIQYSFEGNKVTGQGSRSVFTRFLIEGITTGDADLDGDGNISLDELYSYVYDHVVEEMPRQRPKKLENVEGHIVVARNIHWSLPAHLLNSLASPFSEQRVAALGGLAHLYRVGNEMVQAEVLRQARRLVSDDSKAVSAGAVNLIASLEAETSGLQTDEEERREAEERERREAEERERREAEERERQRWEAEERQRQEAEQQRQRWEVELQRQRWEAEQHWRRQAEAEQRRLAPTRWVAVGLLVLTVAVLMATAPSVLDSIRVSRPLPHDGDAWFVALWLLPALPAGVAATILSVRAASGAAVGLILVALIWVGQSAFTVLLREPDAGLILWHVLLLVVLVATIVAAAVAMPPVRARVGANPAGVMVAAITLVGLAVVLRTVSVSDWAASGDALLNLPAFWLSWTIPLVVGLPGTVVRGNAVQAWAMITLVCAQAAYVVVLTVMLDRPGSAQNSDEVRYLLADVCMVLAVLIGQVRNLRRTPPEAFRAR